MINNPVYHQSTNGVKIMSREMLDKVLTVLEVLTPNMFWLATCTLVYVFFFA